MSRLTRCLVITGFAILTACSSATYRSDWDVETDFSGYEGFAWFERASRGAPPPGHGASPFVVKRIQRAVEAELEAKGMRAEEVGSADLLVTYFFDVNQRVSVHHYGYGYPHSWHWGWGWGGSRVYTYPVGTLVVDVLDRENRQLVWRGVAEAAFTSPDSTDAKVAKVVARLLYDFPPSGA